MKLLRRNAANGISVQQSTAVPNLVEDKASDTAEENYKSPKPAYSKGQLFGLFLGPFLFAVTMLFFSPAGLSSEGVTVLAVTLWVATWWITEAMPIPVTSLLPILLLPLAGNLTAAEVTSSYGADIIFLFLGGFFLALAIEKWNLHKRIALLILRVMGTGTNKLMLGFMLATGFISMWVSATATAVMMMPMGLALVTQIRDSNVGSFNEKDINRFEKALLFSICYAATVGGMATIVGNPPNMVLVAQIKQFFDIDIYFGTWMIFAMPIVVLIMFFSWFYLTRIAFPLNIKSIPGGEKIIEQEKQNLGKTGIEEKIVIGIFAFTAIMWITRGFVWNNIFPNLTDGMIAIFAAMLLFLVPASKEQGGKILNWEDSKDVSWGILLLFGGGLAIAAGFQDSGLSEWIGSNLLYLENFPTWVIITAAVVLVLVLTEITSNTATATILLPIMASAAIALEIHPLVLMIAAVFAANAAFMLPVATPPNAVIFSTGRITILDMVKVGFAMNVTTALLIILAALYLVPLVWGIDISILP